MSRIGKLPIAIPAGVTVTVSPENVVTVKGPKGELSQAVDPLNKVNAIKCLKRVSTPGLRKYVGYREMPRVLNGLGIAILSTSKGVMTNKEALAQQLGGEVLCYVY